MAADTLRCFFALPLQSSALTTLQTLQQRLSAEAKIARLPLRWLRGEQLHVTLKFLGSLSRAALPDLALALAVAARETRQVITTAPALGAFPNPRRASVLVLRLDDADGVIARLASALERAAELAGVPPETRAFKAHLTLARSKPPADVRALIAEHAFEPHRLVFDEVRLYASLLQPAGSEYSVLAAAPLGAGVS